MNKNKPEIRIEFHLTKKQKERLEEGKTIRVVPPNGKNYMGNKPMSKEEKMNLQNAKQKNRDEFEKKFAPEVKPESTYEWINQRLVIRHYEQIKSFLTQAEDRIITSIKSMIDDLDDDGVIHTSEIKKVLTEEEKDEELSEWLEKHGYHSLSRALEKNQKESGKTEKENDLEKIKELRQSLKKINEDIDWLEGVKMDTEDEIGVLELWIDKNKKEL